MARIILAVVLTLFVVAFASGVALLWHFRTQKPREAEKPQKRPNLEYVSREEFEARLKDFAKAQDWQMDEWYEKFSTLHARLAKRQQRAKREQEEMFEEEEPDPAPSVIHLRRMGSV